MIIIYLDIAVWTEVLLIYYITLLYILVLSEIEPGWNMSLYLLYFFAADSTLQIR